MKEEVAYMKILNCINKALIVDLSRYLDKAEYKWFNKIRVV